MQVKNDKEQYFLAFSNKRLEKYLDAVNNDFDRAVLLYEINLNLSKEFYSILSCFEVILRNAINRYYSEFLRDNNWIQNNFILNPIGINSKEKNAIIKSSKKVKYAIEELDKEYSKDKLVSRLNLGFWVNLFNPIQFRIFGQSLHRTFINRPKGINSKEIFNRLDKIKVFRNRIAHYEPISFANKQIISSDYSRKMYNEIKEFILMLGFDYVQLIGHLETVEVQLKKLDELKYKV